MLSPLRLVLNIEAICALAGLLALVGLQALLGLNRRRPVTVLLREVDKLPESEPPQSDSLPVPRSGGAQKSPAVLGGAGYGESKTAERNTPGPTIVALRARCVTNETMMVM
jgi:hypothetical protein